MLHPMVNLFVTPAPCSALEKLNITYCMSLNAELNAVVKFDLISGVGVPRRASVSVLLLQDSQCLV
jgi:hypothetical protein